MLMRHWKIAGIDVIEGFGLLTREKAISSTTSVDRHSNSKVALVGPGH
jgi:hypothetical protein